MKKFFALVPAVAMIMSMASVSFAAFTVSGALDYSNESKKMTAKENYEYGDTVYFLVEDDADTNGEIAKKDYYEKLKVKATFELGEELIKDISLVKKAVKDGVNGQYDTAAYYIAVKLASKNTTAETDVVGEFEINRKAIKADDGVNASAEIEDYKAPIEFTVFYDQTWINDAIHYNVGKSVTEVSLKYDKNYALKFENDDEVELYFGGTSEADTKDYGENEGVFTVDVSGQGKVFLKWNTKADEAIVAANEGVEMFFVNFNGVKFNRAGEFVYDYEDGVAAYKVVDGALVEIPGLEIDDGEFKFNTNVLGNYVFAKAELVNPVVAAPVVEAPVATNPATGA